MTGRVGLADSQNFLGSALKARRCMCCAHASKKKMYTSVGRFSPLWLMCARLCRLSLCLCCTAPRIPHALTWMINDERWTLSIYAYDGWTMNARGMNDEWMKNSLQVALRNALSTSFVSPHTSPSRRLLILISLTMKNIDSQSFELTKLTASPLIPSRPSRPSDP